MRWPLERRPQPYGCSMSRWPLWRGRRWPTWMSSPSSVRSRRGSRRTASTSLESRVDAQLACGRHPETIAELEALTTEHPLRERFWFQRLLALYRAGRQADALRAYRELRSILVDQLGIEPGPELRDLEAASCAKTRRSNTGPPGAARATMTPAGDSLCQERGGPHRLPGARRRRARHRVRAGGDEPRRAARGRTRGRPSSIAGLPALGRLILFDKRDTGLSDRAPGDSPLEERMDDVQAVMNARLLRRAVLFGYSEGAPMSILFAATYPRTVSSLILGSAFARWYPAPDYPCGRRSEGGVRLHGGDRDTPLGTGRDDRLVPPQPRRARCGRARWSRDLSAWRSAPARSCGSSG